MTEEQKEKLKAIIDADFHVKYNGEVVKVQYIQNNLFLDIGTAVRPFIYKVEVLTQVKRVKPFGDCLKWFADNGYIEISQDTYKHVLFSSESFWQFSTMDIYKICSGIEEIPSYFPKELIEEVWE